MKNRIDEIFKNEKKILSIYFSAGHPNLDDTLSVLKNLQKEMCENCRYVLYRKP